MRGDFNAVLLLLSGGTHCAGADPNVANVNSVTPLMMAAIGGSVQVCFRLRCREHSLFGRLLAWSVWGIDSTTPLMMAAIGGSVQVCFRLRCREHSLLDGSWLGQQGLGVWGRLCAPDDGGHWRQHKGVCV